MALEDTYHQWIRGQGGAVGWVARRLLSTIAMPYRAVIAIRNRWYDRPAAQVRFPVPVISIGNITCGGTGKTPTVIDLVRRLQGMGRRPAVVARGYGAGADGPNDEELLVKRSLPNACYVAQPDRRQAIRSALQGQDVDCIVLDDGFQHRRVHRDFDVVLIDATDPFGGGFLLPRGLLRESIGATRRRDLLIITRVDQVAEGELHDIEARLECVSPGTPRISARHAVKSITKLDGTQAGNPARDARVILLAAIGNPAAFERTATGAGFVVVDRRYFPDHHRYSPEDLQRVIENPRTDFDYVLTTEKDAVKLMQISEVNVDAFRVLCIGIDFVGDGGKIWQRMVEEAITRESA